MTRYAGQRDKPRQGRPGPGPVLSVLLGFSILAGGLFAATRGVEWLIDGRHFPLRLVRVTGELRHLGPGDLERAVADVARGGFFTVDLRAVRAAAESLPWVESVRARRVWPDTLQLMVEERRPLGRWNGDRLVSLRGAVFTPSPGDPLPEDLPLLEGPEGSAERVVDTYRAIQARLASSGLGLSRLSLTEREAWSAQLTGGPRVLFGTHHLASRLETLLRAYPGLQSRERGVIERIDLRYANGLSVLSKRPDSVEGVADGNRRDAPTG